MSSLRRAMLLSAAAASLAGAGCRDRIEAGLYLVFRSELAVPGDLDGIEVQVTHRERGEELRFEIPLGGPEGYFLPTSHGITPSQSKKPGPYTFKAIGKLKGKAKTVYEFVTDIPRDHVVSVDVPLQFLCYDQAKVLPDGQTVGLCPQGLTCIAGECKPIPVYDGKSLPSYDPKELGIDPSATCYDAAACFNPPLILLPDLDTCRIARPASSNLTVGLLLPLTKPGLPYFGRKLVVFDADGLAGYSVAGNEVQLPAAICNVMRNDPNILLIGSTTCASKKERDPICRPSLDAGLLSTDLGLPVDDVAYIKDGLGADDYGAPDTPPPDALEVGNADSYAVDSVVPDVVETDSRAPGECSTVDGFKPAGAPCGIGGVCSGAGECVFCLPNSSRCIGKTLQVCSTAATWSQGIECQIACLDGRCVECAPGELRCTGNTPQACSSSGFWQSLAPCTTRCGGAGVCERENVLCWGSNEFGQATPPARAFMAVSAGSEYTCGLHSDRTVECWGGNVSGRATPLTGSFRTLSASNSFACAIRLDGSVGCWGNNFYEQATPKPGEFLQISTGLYHACGVRATGAAECWGLNWDGRATPKPGVFSSVASGAAYTCGVRPDGSVECWGGNDDQQLEAKPGQFSIVSAGSAHACAIRLDGGIDCWGANGVGQAVARAGSFVSVSAGYQHTCAVRTDGVVECWGANSHGQATPKPGKFVSVSAGDTHTCGVLRQE